MYGQKMLPATSKLARPHLKILGKAVQRQDNRQAFRLRCQRPFRALSKSAEANIPDGTTFRENRAVIVSPLWPERSSSAAGVRTWGLIDLFESWLWKISYLSPAKPNSYTDELQARGIDTYSIRPNRRDELQRVLRAVKPTVCVFDRFFAEEAFSFVVRETCPEALRVLDTQDLHFLRAGRQEQAARSSEPDACISEVMGHLPSAESAALLRELAAVHRSDVCMACSPVEAALLSERYGVDRRKVLLSSFLCDPPDTGGNPGFASRQHFVTIGNFRHPPNADSVEWLADHVWERVRGPLWARGERAEMHVYGAYPTARVRALHSPERGLHVLGHAPSLAVLRRYRACLAPLRFGAGLKGKILDSWAHGLPVCTTPVGAEGLFIPNGFPGDAGLDEWLIAKNGGYEELANVPWGGRWSATTAARFAEDAVELYGDEKEWERCQAEGYNILEALFDKRDNSEHLRGGLATALSEIDERRKHDYVGNILWQQSFRATEFFSRWIELKETGK